MLAARARGIGTAWTTLHLATKRLWPTARHSLRFLPQVALIPIAYKGTDFKPAYDHRLKVMHINQWSS